MKKEFLIESLNNIVSEAKSNMESLRTLMEWLDEFLPREEELKEQSRMVISNKGEVFLCYNGIQYSWEIIVSILREQGMITINSLYDVAIN